LHPDETLEDELIKLKVPFLRLELHYRRTLGNQDPFSVTFTSFDRSGNATAELIDQPPEAQPTPEALDAIQLKNVVVLKPNGALRDYAGAARNATLGYWRHLIHLPKRRLSLPAALGNMGEDAPLLVLGGGLLDPIVQSILAWMPPPTSYDVFHYSIIDPAGPERPACVFLERHMTPERIEDLPFRFIPVRWNPSDFIAQLSAKLLP